MYCSEKHRQKQVRDTLEYTKRIQLSRRLYALLFLVIFCCICSFFLLPYRNHAQRIVLYMHRYARHLRHKGFCRKDLFLAKI